LNPYYFYFKQNEVEAKLDGRIFLYRDNKDTHIFLDELFANRKFMIDEYHKISMTKDKYICKKTLSIFNGSYFNII